MKKKNYFQMKYLYKVLLEWRHHYFIKWSLFCIRKKHSIIFEMFISIPMPYLISLHVPQVSEKFKGLHFWSNTFCRYSIYVTLMSLLVSSHFTWRQPNPLTFELLSHDPMQPQVINSSIINIIKLNLQKLIKNLFVLIKFSSKNQ